MPGLSEITLDSQCLSFLIDALEAVARPTDSLADQRIVLAHLYFYTPGALWVTPTVKEEFERIKDAARRDSHQSWTSALFGVRAVNDPAAVECQAAYLEQFHAGKRNDCTVLAEAEDIGFAALLSYDHKFVNASAL